MKKNSAPIFIFKLMKRQTMETKTVDNSAAGGGRRPCVRAQVGTPEMRWQLGKSPGRDSDLHAAKEIC